MNSFGKLVTLEFKRILSYSAKVTHSDESLAEVELKR